MNPLKTCGEPRSAGHFVLDPRKPDPTSIGKCACAIMTKAPHAGQVKTRLSPPLTPTEAAVLNGCFLRDISNAIEKAGESCRGIACYTPVGEEATYRDLLPASFQLLPQHLGALEIRLAAALRDLLAIGFGSVCLLNSDSPTVPASTFAEAADILSRPEDAIVVGPADDGGYYLLGCKKLHLRLFEQIEWSTARVFEQTLARAAEKRITVHLLPVCSDIDDASSLRRLSLRLLDSDHGLEKGVAAATEEFLRELIAREGHTRLWPVV
ncbi:MAG: TIGR04282 family arsenosugar biosynthesis glycosyltransferase [Spartobacteria bacterium]